MSEGLTDKMRCVRCGARWDQRNDSESLRHCPHPTSHEWLVPVAAVTEAIAQLSDDFDRGVDELSLDVVAGYYEALADFTAAFHFEGDT